MPKPPSLTFLGAAGEVTGSCTLLETEHARVLVDFGLFQGEPSQELRNAVPPAADFRRLNAVVCTHAHIDHCGRLGMLPGLGYEGLVFCTEPTAELLPMVLRSSANLQKVRLDEHRDGTGPDAVVLDPPPDPARVEAQKRDFDPPVLYSKGDAERVSRGIVGVPYLAWRDIAPGVRMRFHDAAHIIGSASVEFEVVHGASRVRIVFSGDIGPAGEGYLRARTHAPVGPRKGRVSLLAGCAQQVLDPDITAATIEVLARNGVEVVVPRSQGCCGGLAWHTGDLAAAQAFARRNLDAFPAEIELPNPPMIASGCATMIISGCRKELNWLASTM